MSSDSQTWANSLPAANSRRPFCLQPWEEIPCSLASSELGSPAAVAEGERSDSV